MFVFHSQSRKQLRTRAETLKLPLKYSDVLWISRNHSCYSWMCIGPFIADNGIFWVAQYINNVNVTRELFEILLLQYSKNVEVGRCHRDSSVWRTALVILPRLNECVSLAAAVVVRIGVSDKPRKFLTELLPADMPLRRCCLRSTRSGANTKEMSEQFSFSRSHH